MRIITNGESESNLHIREIYNGVREAEALAEERERGKTTVVSIEDDRVVKEDIRFDNTTKSYSRERGNVRRTTDVRVQESFEFSGFQESRTITADFEF